MNKEKLNRIMWFIGDLKKEVNYMECEAQDDTRLDFMLLSGVWDHLDEAEQLMSTVRQKIEEAESLKVHF